MLLFEDKIFTEWRLRLYGICIAATYAALLIWEIFFNGKSVMDSDGKPSCIDFCWIWVSGNFALSIDPALAYDYSIFTAAQAALVGPTQGGFPFFPYQYPPTFLFLTLPLGLISYYAAFVVWTVGTLLLYLAAIYAIIPRPTAAIVALTPVPVLENFVLGHNGFLTAAFIGLSLALMERRPWLSGVFIGLLTYKPQFGVLLPLALLVSCNWRAFASAVVSTVILSIGAAIAFGYRGWLMFIDGLRGLNSSLSSDSSVEPITLQSIYYTLHHWMGLDVWTSWALHLAVGAVVTLAVCVVWARRTPYALKAAALCVGILEVTPYVQVYDLCILSIAAAFLVKGGLSSGFLPGERTMLLACFVGLFFLPRPVGPIIYAIMLLLILRRAMPVLFPRLSATI